MEMDKDYTDLAVKIAEVDERAKSNTHRIDELDKKMESVHETQLSLVKIANSVENMGKSMIKVEEKVDEINDKQDKLNEKVTILENEPAQKTHKRVNDIVEKVLWVIAGGVVVGILGHLFPGLPW